MECPVIAERPRCQPIGKAQNGQQGTQPAAGDGSATEEIPEEDHDGKWQKGRADQSQPGQSQAEQQAGEGAAPLAATGAKR